MNPYVRLLYQALATEFGLIVSHENPQSARSQFYAARKKHGDPLLNKVSITILEDRPNQLYLVTNMEPEAQCPSESQPPSPESMSGSSLTTFDGSGKPMDQPSELPRQSEPSSEPSV